MTVVVIGGGIAGLAAIHRLAQLMPADEPWERPVLVERETSVGGKLLTEHVGGFVIEAGADSFLSRKPRGTALCEELGLRHELVGRKPEHARTFVRRGRDLHPLPEGLTGMIPTNLDALSESALLSVEGRERLAAEVDIPPDLDRGDESIASFVSRRLGSEAYDKLVEPLMTGIFGGDGEQLSLRATFPQLRELELEHGSVLRGLGDGSAPGRYPPFVTLGSGMDALVRAASNALEGRIGSALGEPAVSLRSDRNGFVVELGDRSTIDADAVVVAVPAFAAAPLLAGIDDELAELHAEIPYASSAIVTLAYREEDVSHPLDGYGYVVPRTEHTDVLACTWTSQKWEGRAPEGSVLIRVYLGRFGERDVTKKRDRALLALARGELELLGISAKPTLTRVRRWPHGMPQYVLGHPERLARIDAALERHPGLALAGAAYRGVGIPDCIDSGEQAAETVARALARVPG
jgi:oxygen-dependent protoporphyrinogen oxidase